VSQVVAVPLCVLADQFKGGPFWMQYLVGIATAVLPLYVQPALGSYLTEQGWATDMDVLAGRFVGSTTYAFTAFRIFGAAAGGTPKGADADVATWIAYATAAVDPLFDKESGKPIRPSSSAIPNRIRDVLVRLFFLSIVSSISHPHGGFPAKAYATANGGSDAALAVAFVVDGVLVQLMLIFLFLSLLMDVGAMLLLVQNFSVLTPFEKPMFATRSPRDFWGKKWNIQVTTTLKRCVFIPLRKHLGVPTSAAAIATFLSSGLFHEYQFLLSFPKYQLGSISFFFGMHALIAFLESLVEKAFGKGWPLESYLPAVLKSMIILVVFSPTIPYFTKIWLDEGMYDVMSLMAPQIKYQ